MWSYWFLQQYLVNKNFFIKRSNTIAIVYSLPQKAWFKLPAKTDILPSKCWEEDKTGSCEAASEVVTTARRGSWGNGNGAQSYRNCKPNQNRNDCAPERHLYVLPLLIRWAAETESMIVSASCISLPMGCPIRTSQKLLFFFIASEVGDVTGSTLVPVIANIRYCPSSSS